MDLAIKLIPIVANELCKVIVCASVCYLMIQVGKLIIELLKGME